MNWQNKRRLTDLVRDFGRCGINTDSVQSLSRVQHFATPWIAACQASLSITNSWSLLKLISIESVMPSNHLILHRPLLLLPSVIPSIRSFPVIQFFASGGQSTGASASVLPMNIQDWFPLQLTGLISLQSKGLSSVFSSADSSTEGKKEVISSWWLQGEVKHSPGTVVFLWSEGVWREMMAEKFRELGKCCKALPSESVLLEGMSSNALFLLSPLANSCSDHVCCSVWTNIWFYQSSKQEYRIPVNINKSTL